MKFDRRESAVRYSKDLQRMMKQQRKQRRMYQIKEAIRPIGLVVVWLVILTVWMTIQ